MAGTQGGKRGHHSGLEEAGYGTQTQLWDTKTQIEAERPEEAREGPEEAGRLHTRMNPSISPLLPLHVANRSRTEKQEARWSGSSIRRGDTALQCPDDAFPSFV